MRFLAGAHQRQRPHITVTSELRVTGHLAAAGVRKRLRGMRPRRPETLARRLRPSHRSRHAYGMTDPFGAWPEAPRTSADPAEREPTRAKTWAKADEPLSTPCGSAALPGPFGVEVREIEPRASTVRLTSTWSTANPDELSRLVRGGSRQVPDAHEPAEMGTDVPWQPARRRPWKQPMQWRPAGRSSRLCSGSRR